MALSNTQAQQINVLLEWLLAIDRPVSASVSWDEARNAAASLADAASKQLGAGLNSELVLSRWDRQNASGALRTRRGKLARRKGAAT